MYDNIQGNYTNPSYLRDREILTPSNDYADKITEDILVMLPGQKKIYLSADTIVEMESSKNNQGMLYTTKFLNTLKVPGLLDHYLKLKVGAPFMLLCNLNQSIGLCNGTRLIVKQLGRQVIEAEIITGTDTSQRVFIP